MVSLPKIAAIAFIGAFAAVGTAYANPIIDLGTSGIANNGTLVGNTSISNNAAVGTGALRSGPAAGPPESTRMIVGGDLTDLDMTNAYTYMAWVNVLADGSKGLIGLGACCTPPAGGTQNQGREGYTLNYQSNGRLRYWGGSTDDDANYNLFTGPNLFGLGAYHHVAVRVAPGDVDIFVDGISVATNDRSNLNTSPSLLNQNNLNTPGAPSIGGPKVDNVNDADVLIDEVRVYGFGLSDLDILGIANGAVGPAADRLYYDFESQVPEDQVPEPATLTLFGLGLLGLGAARRRTKKTA